MAEIVRVGMSLVRSRSGLTAIATRDCIFLLLLSAAYLSSYLHTHTSREHYLTFNTRLDKLGILRFNVFVYTLPPSFLTFHPTTRPPLYFLLPLFEISSFAPFSYQIFLFFNRKSFCVLITCS